MNAFALARRFLRWRAIATSLAILSIALAVGMVIAVRSVPNAIGAGTAEPAVRLPVVVGRGESRSRLVLGIVFLEPPAPPALPLSLLEEARRAPGVAEAFPIHILHDGGVLVSTSRSYFRQTRDASRWPAVAFSTIRNPTLRSSVARSRIMRTWAWGAA